MTISSINFYHISDTQAEVCPVVTTCSSSEGYDSSCSSIMTRATRKIWLTICTIGSIGECGTFQ